YIDSVWFEGAIWQLNQSNTIVAKIINASEEPVEEGTLTLTINGKQKSLANFSIPAKGNKEIKMNFTVTEKGNNQASVTITDYPITFDDAFYFNFNVADEVGILCVNGTKKAPEIIRAFNAEKAFKVEEVSASNLDYSGFASHKFIILNGVENISSGFASALSEYAKNGGNVLLIPDENINTNSYNEYLQAEGAPMLSTLNNTGYKVNDFAVKNPFFAGVFDDISANINLPEVKKYYSVSTSKNTNVNVLMRLANGDAFLTQSTAGKGFIYVLASGINKDWCNLTNHALFLPLMYRMALYTENSGRIAYAIGKDNYVQIAPTMLKQSGQNNDKKEVVKIFKNKFEVTPPQRAVDGALSLYVEGFIREAGHYSVGSPNEKATNSVSFNYDRNESIMKFLTADELKEKGAALNMKFLDATKASMTTAVKEINQGNSLWKYFIIAAIIFLLGETVLTRIWR
ncbi:MAG: hypothetical protein NTX03_14515, partial [Bacteroidetes bacterium]|nr:hypothetical protein [Bacteroidota bacterium]